MKPQNGRSGDKLRNRKHFPIRKCQCAIKKSRRSCNDRRDTGSAGTKSSLSQTSGSASTLKPSKPPTPTVAGAKSKREAKEMVRQRSQRGPVNDSVTIVYPSLKYDLLLNELDMPRSALNVLSLGGLHSFYFILHGRPTETQFRMLEMAKVAILVVVGATHLAAPVVIPCVAQLLGFGRGGIVAGSIATKIMASYGGEIVPGSICADLQSIGATGMCFSKAFPCVAQLLGFGSGGIVAGSIATKIMASYGGEIVPGSICADLQSIGATGMCFSKAFPCVAQLLGFGSGGIVAGSTAAKIMASYGGEVVQGSICADLQSIGATGMCFSKAFPCVAQLLGFGSGGIVAGSTAAKIMASYGGEVVPGSICAVLQSSGATGMCFSKAFVPADGLFWAAAAALQLS